MTNITILPPLNLEHPNLLVVGYAKQNDVKSRLYQAQMLAGDEAWEPPANATAALRFRKGDNHGGWYDTLEDNSTPAVTWTGSTVTMAMAEQVLTCPGIVLIDLEFSGPDGSVLSFFRWQLVVEANAVDDAILTESSDYFNILHQEMTAVLAAAANLTGLTAEATTLAPGSAATAEVTGGTGGNPYVLNLGIPRGNVGPAPTASSVAYAYAQSSSGTTQPDSWSGTRPTLTPGMYLWTKITITWDNNSTTVLYTVSYQGLNGQGAVNSVCSVSPDGSGNVLLTASDIPTSGANTVDQELSAIRDIAEDARQIVRTVSLKFSPARTVPADSQVVLTSGTDLSAAIPSGWDITYAAVVYIQGNVCFPCNHTINGNVLYLSVRNPTSAATTISEVILYIFAAPVVRQATYEVTL